MLISMLRLKYIVLVVCDLPDKFNFCINRGWVQNLDQINSLTSIKYNRYNIIVLWDVNEWFNLVIALHSPIFSGECFLAAGDYGGNVLVSIVFLFFFYTEGRWDGGRGKQQGFASYTFMCRSRHGTSCLKLQLLNIQLSQNQYC